MRNQKGQFIKGNKHTNDFIKNQSIRMSGENNPFFGKSHTKEMKEKMSQAKLKNPTRYWLGKKRPDTSERNKTIFKGRFVGEKSPVWLKFISKRFINEYNR